MQKKFRRQSAESQKLDYEKPSLTCFGKVRDLTAGGSMGMSEFMMGMMGKPETCSSNDTMKSADCLP